MSQEWIIYLVVALIFLILLLVGVVLMLGYKIFKSQGAVTFADPNEHRNRLKELSGVPEQDTAQVENEKESSQLDIEESSFSVQNELANKHFCTNHPSDHAAGVCAICQNSYCEECIKEHEGHSFCEAHFRLYLSHQWNELDTIRTTPDIPESALPLYDFKKALWEEKEIPSLLSTHYKINIEDDFIESYVKLIVRKEEWSQLKDRYEKLKQ